MSVMASNKRHIDRDPTQDAALGNLSAHDADTLRRRELARAAADARRNEHLRRARERGDR